MHAKISGRISESAEQGRSIPTGSGQMLRPYNYIHANDSKTRLLRTAGSVAEGGRQGYPCGVSQAGAEVSPRFESGRQILGRKIQATAGSLRRPLRFQEAADVRPVRLLQRQPSTGRAGWRGRSRRGAGRQPLFWRVCFLGQRPRRRGGGGALPAPHPPCFSRGAEAAGGG